MEKEENQIWANVVKHKATCIIRPNGKEVSCVNQAQIVITVKNKQYWICLKHLDKYFFAGWDGKIVGEDE